MTSTIWEKRAQKNAVKASKKSGGHITSQAREAYFRKRREDCAREMLALGIASHDQFGLIRDFIETGARR